MNKFKLELHHNIYWLYKVHCKNCDKNTTLMGGLKKEMSYDDFTQTIKMIFGKEMVALSQNCGHCDTMSVCELVAICDP